jgi:glycosyltransferase involved in cell wall biosynthesis
MMGSAMPHPLLSVIVANFNKEEYLPECLDSILNQTFRDFEIVVYDDGSSDGSLAIIENFRQRYPDVIKVIADPVNRGVAYARHQAILAAGGEYLTTLDSDDYYFNRLKLEKEIALIRYFKEKEKKEIIAFSNILLLNNSEPPCLWGNPENIRQGFIGCSILCRSCFIPRDFMMKRDWYFQAGGYDLHFEIYEDWDLKIRLAMTHEFHFSGEVGTVYRRHGRGLSGRPFDEHVVILREVFEKNLHLAAAAERQAARCAFEDWLANPG